MARDVKYLGGVLDEVKQHEKEEKLKAIKDQKRNGKQVVEGDEGEEEEA